MLRHGDDMEALWNIENASLHPRKTSKQETSKQSLLKAGSLKRKAIILVRYVYNLPDYNTGHNMMKQKDVLRQSSVRILLFEYHCPPWLGIHGKKNVPAFTLWAL